jgi:hypothetical protein
MHWFVAACSPRHAALRVLAVTPIFIELIGTAWADTVDAQAKPYFVVGGWVFAIVCAAAAFFLLRKGMRLRNAAQAVTGWSMTDGEVLESGVGVRVDGYVSDSPVKRYTPQVRYNYTAGGEARQGDVVRLGLSEVGYAADRPARDHADRYPVGASVSVRYDPENPGTSVLELGQAGGYGKLLGGVIFAALAVCGVVFAAWIVGLEAR